MNDFSALASHPMCTHRQIIGYNVASTGEPVPFWACAACGRRFEPTQPSEEQAHQLDVVADHAPEPDDRGHSKHYYTPHEVAEILAVSDDAVLDLIEKGELPAVGRHGSRRIPVPAFDRWREGSLPVRRAVGRTLGRVELARDETLPTPSSE